MINFLAVVRGTPEVTKHQLLPPFPFLKLQIEKSIHCEVAAPTDLQVDALTG